MGWTEPGGYEYSQLVLTSNLLLPPPLPPDSSGSAKQSSLASVQSPVGMYKGPLSSPAHHWSAWGHLACQASPAAVSQLNNTQGTGVRVHGPPSTPAPSFSRRGHELAVGCRETWWEEEKLEGSS